MRFIIGQNGQPIFEGLGASAWTTRSVATTATSFTQPTQAWSTRIPATAAAEPVATVVTVSANGQTCQVTVPNDPKLFSYVLSAHGARINNLRATRSPAVANDLAQAISRDPNLQPLIQTARKTVKCSGTSTGLKTPGIIPHVYSGGLCCDKGCVLKSEYSSLGIFQGYWCDCGQKEGTMSLAGRPPYPCPGGGPATELIIVGVIIAVTAIGAALLFTGGTGALVLAAAAA